MLDLDSPVWAALSHAYGSAVDIPEYLRKLDPTAETQSGHEPWLSLWSALAHQGDVYSASYAAVPHIIYVLSNAPLQASFDYFALPAWIEICRRKLELTVPSPLNESYYDALSQFPRLIGEAAGREWDAGFLQSALAALAVSKGFSEVAEAASELSPEVARDFLKWFEGR